MTRLTYGILATVALFIVIGKLNPQTADHAAQQTESVLPLTLEVFRSVRIGSDAGHALAAFGDAESRILSEVGTGRYATSLVEYKNPGFLNGRVTVMFQNGSVVALSQFGLR